MASPLHSLPTPSELPKLLSYLTPQERARLDRILRAGTEESSSCLWPSPYNEDSADAQYRFLTECCWTWDDETGESLQIPDLPHVRFISDLVWHTKSIGRPIILEKARRLLASWVIRACRLFSGGLRKETGVIAGENYEKAAEHCWRVAYIYERMREERPEMRLAKCLPREGNMDAHAIGQLILPNGTLIDTLNASGNSFQGRGKTWVDMEEFSLYPHPGSMWFQAKTVTKGRADVTGGHVLAVTNASPSVAWQEIKEIARVLENHDPSWEKCANSFTAGRD
jgi:hypothetical protein